MVLRTNLPYITKEIQMIKTQYIPAIVFIFAIFIYLLVFKQFNLTSTNYNYSHFIFGFFTPLILGYTPVHLLFDKKERHSLFTLDLKELNYTRYDWSLLSGVLLTLYWSIDNEIFIDPKENGNSFFNTYTHFIYDISGIICISFIVLTILWWIQKTHK